MAVETGKVEGGGMIAAVAGSETAVLVAGVYPGHDHHHGYDDHHAECQCGGMYDRL